MELLDETKLPKEWKEATDIMAEHIREEIDREILAELMALSTLTNADEKVVPLDQPSTPTYPYDSEGSYFHSLWDEPVSDITIKPINKCEVPLLTFTPNPVAITVFVENNKKLLEIMRTGEVVLGEAVTPVFAAQEFWTRVAEIGGQFAKRTEELENTLADLEMDLEDEQSMRLELEETLNEICNALQIPSGREDQVVDFVKKIAEQQKAGSKLIRELKGEEQEKKPSDLNKAYEAAMKIVR